MGRDPDFSDDDSLDGELEAEIVAKNEAFHTEVQLDARYPRRSHENGASSSSSVARSYLIGAGFAPSLVDKVIEERGDHDVDLLLEVLLPSSSIPEQKSESSNSLDELFDEKDDASNRVADVHPKEEPDPLNENEFMEEKKATLLSMEFSSREVDFAVATLGGHTPIPELMDFILAARVEETLENGNEQVVKCEDSTEETNVESLYQTMDTTFCLIEMGFSENEVSAAIEKFGSERPISELANLICGGQVFSSCNAVDQPPTGASHSRLHFENGHGSSSGGYATDLKRRSTYALDVKEEQDDEFLRKDIDYNEDRKGKRVRQEGYFPVSNISSDPSWMRTKINSRVPNRFQRPDPGSMKLGAIKSQNKVVAKSPYFLYGNVMNLSSESWSKVSQFMFGIEPEFVKTLDFSALDRAEGYVHNFPTENRIHVIPKSPRTIEEVIPETKKYQPSWDTRKHLTNISSETAGVYELCDRLGKTLINSYGLPSPAMKNEILHQCNDLGLVWFGQNRLGPLEPEHVEHILGYPLRHTQVSEWTLGERLQALKYCFQIDTIAYQLSVMRHLFPDGVVLLSIFSGIGGTEIALHSMGIRLKAVVSIETCPIKRKILKKWWRDSDQTGELVQLEDIEKLTTAKLGVLSEMFHGFDLLVCQNPCTNSAKGVRISENGDGFSAFDFSLFYEFVRVIQRVRSLANRME